MDDKIQTIVQALVKSYDWQLSSVETLAKEVKEQISFRQDKQELSDKQIQILSIRTYCRLALYPACYGIHGQKQQERGFAELSVYLHRLAYKNWPQIAEVVTQRALVQIFKTLKKCRKPEAFLVFSYQKLRDQAKKDIKSESKTESLEKILEQSSKEDFPISIDIGVWEEENLEETTAQKELRSRVAERIRAIRQENLKARRQIDAVWLRYFCYLSTEEIADILDITSKNVSVLINRGKRQLRQDKELWALATEILNLDDDQVQDT